MHQACPDDDEDMDEGRSLMLTARSGLRLGRMGSIFPTTGRPKIPFPKGFACFTGSLGESVIGECPWEGEESGGVRG